MRTSRTLILSLLLAGGAQAGAWSDLWYRPDQQGQQALAAGDPKRAAELFTDPRRQAYAQLQADQNAAAAKTLAPFEDAASQYNRGNALAKSGDLKAALDAYDSALKHPDLETSLHSDAQHNRDLVARQLAEQKDQPHDSSSQQPPTTQENKGKSESKESKATSDGSGSSTSPPTAGSDNSSPGKKNESDGGTPAGSTPPSASTPASSSRQGKAGGDERQANGNPHSTQEQSASRGQSSPDSAENNQANRGTEDKNANSASRQGKEPLRTEAASNADSKLPQSEQQLALEQWLRQIPDDPGGLLRRKFLIEHMMKQQREVQP